MNLDPFGFFIISHIKNNGMKMCSSPEEQTSSFSVTLNFKG